MGPAYLNCGTAPRGALPVGLAQVPGGDDGDAQPREESCTHQRGAGAHRLGDPADDRSGERHAADEDHTYRAAIRPRIAVVDVIWIIAFAVVAIVRMLRPTSGSTAMYE